MRKYKVTIQPKRLNWRKNPMYDKNYYFDSARKQWFVDGKPWDSPGGTGFLGCPARVSVRSHLNYFLPPEQNTGLGPQAGCSDCNTLLEAYGWCPSCHLHQSLPSDGPLSLAERILDDPDASHTCAGSNIGLGPNAGRSVPLAPGDPGVPPGVDPIHVTTMLGGDGYAHQSWPEWAVPHNEPPLTS